MAPNHYSSARAVKVAVGQTIRYLRDEKNLTREQVASELGTTATTIYRWETNRATPGLGDLNALASVYETDLSSLMPTSKAIKDTLDYLSE